MEKVGIVIVDDQNIFRQILGLAIANVEGLYVVNSYANGQNFLNDLANGTARPDIAILDIDMPGIDGVKLNAAIQRDHPDVRTIMLSQHREPQLIASLIRAGAAAYLDKDCTQEELITAIQSVHTTGYYMNAYVFGTLQKKFSNSNRSNPVLNNLTEREVEVLRLLCLEKTNAEIAEELFVSTKTIDFHRANLLLKTESKNLAGLVLYAIKNDIVQV
ncbi:response regulator transcription factor [Mucilaginibacter daejeonensis]|uniref:response regulator transcription factor n=1 Tax=Mucilaginibacter daejeonensis TaxID=398049 RepID=UPI001D17784F|nr:response regulator transcription factor [Mucilaginibacter daejeonensis]UEG54793.1 response regulator transcription factor [Mucilaginibacter daejeonensis]